MKKIILSCSLTLFSVVLTSCRAQQRLAAEAFEFRGIYSPTGAIDSLRRAYDIHHVDYDWDLWGHNLHKILGSKPESDVLAIVAGRRDKMQYCFSSERMYARVRAYIIDNFGYGEKGGKPVRITLMPQDNKKVCTCRRCQALGNTPTNATPAVTHLLRRLARQFPNHQFFTSAYHSTRTAPDEPLPDNVGVIVSAIDLPMRMDFRSNRGYATFVDMVGSWKQRASLIYVWDYPRNYSDYLSPFPCLKVMQQRFRLYRELGVKGVFLNGSGDDYSAFDDMQTYVLARLLHDVNTDVDEAVRTFFRHHYPVSGELIADYYLALERRVVDTNHILPLYGSIGDEVESYLDPEAFRQFRAQLDRLSKSIGQPERMRLNHLLTALSFTQLQLLDMPGAQPDSELRAEMKAVLRGHTEIPNMQNYGETDASIDKYLEELK